MKLWEEMNQRIKKFGIIDEKLAQLTAIISLALLLMVFSFVGCSGDDEGIGKVPFPEIDGNAVLKHTRILSSDEFEG